jgi:hypothetical protein
MPSWITRKGLMDYSLNKVIKLTLLMKASILVLIYLGYHFLSFNAINYNGNFVYPAGEAPGPFTLFKTWDAQHYLYLADQGYHPGQMSNAFYPLLPFLIHLTGFLFLSHTMAAGLFVSHALTLIAMGYLYLFVKKRYDEKTAFFSCLLLLAFPAGFYIGLIYTESLFLALSTALFYYCGEKKLLPAIFCAFLLPFTRPTGLFVILPIFAGIFWGEFFKEKSYRFKKLLIPLGLMAGFAGYLILMKIFTGEFFAGPAAEKYIRTNYSITHLFHPIDWFVMNFIKTDFSVAGLHSGIINRLLFVGYLAVLLLARKHLNRTLFAYSLVLGLIPALSGDFASYMRYLVVLFPLFIYLAVKLKENAEYYMLACLPLQALFALAHSLNYWVA